MRHIWLVCLSVFSWEYVFAHDLSPPLETRHPASYAESTLVATGEWRFPCFNTIRGRGELEREVNFLREQTDPGALKAAFTNSDRIRPPKRRGKSKFVRLVPPLYATAVFPGLTCAGLRRPLAVRQSAPSSCTAERRTWTLDLLVQAGTAYLTLLQLKALLRLERRNHELTEHHLRLARARCQFVATHPSELFLWENRLQMNQQALMDASKAVCIAESQLNRLLRQLSWSLFQSEGTFLQQIASLDISDFVNAEGWRRFYSLSSHELQRLLASIQVTGISSFCLPAFELFSSRPSPFAHGVIGATLCFPFYEGMANCIRVLSCRASLQGFHFLCYKTLNTVEQNIGKALDLAYGSLLHIENTLATAQTTCQNLRFFAASYARGMANALDLLNAQHAHLLAQRAGACAEYAFVIDLLHLMRSLGCFDFLLSDCRRDQWLHHLDHCFRHRG